MFFSFLVLSNDVFWAGTALVYVMKLKVKKLLVEAKSLLKKYIVKMGYLNDEMFSIYGEHFLRKIDRMTENKLSPSSSCELICGSSFLN